MCVVLLLLFDRATLQRLDLAAATSQSATAVSANKTLEIELRQLQEQMGKPPLYIQLAVCYVHAIACTCLFDFLFLAHARLLLLTPASRPALIQCSARNASVIPNHARLTLPMTACVRFCASR